MTCTTVHIRLALLTQADELLSDEGTNNPLPFTQGYEYKTHILPQTHNVTCEAHDLLEMDICSRTHRALVSPRGALSYMVIILA